LARQVKWRHHVHSIASTVQNSKIEAWTRVDLERVFCVSRASAQTIMRAVGEVQDIGGGKHIVDRTSLLSYLEAMIGADDLRSAHKARLEVSEPVPKVRAITKKIPDDLKTIMVKDLPAEITLEPGRIEIRGENSEVLVERLWSLAMALQNDLNTAAQMLDQPRQEFQPVDDELRSMFQDLREQETRWAASRNAPKEMNHELQLDVA
jgi:hypothetical protein